MSDHFILLCSTCQGPVSAETAQDRLLGQLPPGYAIRLIDCMAGCNKPLTAGFQAKDKAQYLFGNIRTLSDLSALAEFAHQFQASADGWTSASDRPPALLTKTLSRIPRLPSEGTT